MAKRSIIGLTGQMGCGKSTAATYITEKYGFTEYSFANPLKNIAVIMGFNNNQVFGTQEQKLEINNLWGVSGREFLQKFGTDVCRETLPGIFHNHDFKQYTIWIKLFEKYCADNPDLNIIVSDVRFPDEARFITSAGGSIIKIERDTKSAISSVNTHKSEVPIPECYVSYVIKNNYSMKNLHEDIDEALKELL